MDAHGLAGRPATSAGPGAAAKTSRGGVLSRARITQYGRSLRPTLARFSRAPNAASSPGDLLFACATGAEERVAKRAGFRTARVGVCARRGAPGGELVSFGVAGGLNGLEIGTVLDATRIVDERGCVLWEGAGLGIAGAFPATILATARLVEDPAERRRLHELTGADAVDMESGVLAATGRLRGCLRAVSDTPERPLGPLGEAVTPDGRARPLGFLKVLLREPGETLRALSDIRTALKALAGSARTASAFRPEGTESA